MPKRTDISSILIIGAGPIVIGQACEFDYSGTQACKALREEGYRVVLVNSNPATIMTDPEFADRTYIEPITPEAVEKIIVRELAEMKKIAPEEMERLKASSKAYYRAPEPAASPAAARQLAWLAFADIMVFFAVLLVGFAYLWRRGDLNWVRSTAAQTNEIPPVATGGLVEPVHGNA